MRLVSADGMIDVPYENTLLKINKNLYYAVRENHEKNIKSNHEIFGSTLCYSELSLGRFETMEAAKEELKRIHDAYRQGVSVYQLKEGGD